MLLLGLSHSVISVNDAISFCNLGLFTGVVPQEKTWNIWIPLHLAQKTQWGNTYHLKKKKLENTMVISNSPGHRSDGQSFGSPQKTTPLLLKRPIQVWGWQYSGSPKLVLPSGKHTKNYGKSPFLMGKSTISMAIFNSYVSLPEGKLVLYPRFPSWNHHIPMKDELYSHHIPMK